MFNFLFALTVIKFTAFFNENPADFCQLTGHLRQEERAHREVERCRPEHRGRGDGDGAAVALAREAIRRDEAEPREGDHQRVPDHGAGPEESEGDGREHVEEGRVASGPVVREVAWRGIHVVIGEPARACDVHVGLVPEVRQREGPEMKNGQVVARQRVTSGFTQLDASIGKSFWHKRITLQAGARNLLDAQSALITGVSCKSRMQP